MTKVEAHKAVVEAQKELKRLYKTITKLSTFIAQNCPHKNTRGIEYWMQAHSGWEKLDLKVECLLCGQRFSKSKEPPKDLPSKTLNWKGPELERESEIEE